MTGPAAPAVDPEATVTLRDLLSVASFGLRLRAAPEEVDRPVRWAHPTELVDPRPYLYGRELVLTVGTSLQDAAVCRHFVACLLDAGVSAVGYGVGDVSAEIPPALVEECRAAGLPLLQVPAGVPFQSITEMLAERRAQARAARGHRLQELVVRLLDAIAQDHGITELQSIVDADLGGRTTFCEGTLSWEPLLPSDVRPGPDFLGHLGKVLAVREREENADLRQRRLEMGRLVELVVEGRADPEVLHHPLVAAGVDVTRPVVVAAWPPGAADLLGPWGTGWLVAECDEVTLTVSDDPDAVLRLARESALPCGVGAPGPLAELHRAVPPARGALSLARTRGGAVSGSDLASFDGLLEQQPPERLSPFTQTLIRPLVEQDREHGTALVQTLKTFLEVDGSIKETAEQLFLHPNSLRHRLRRVHELTGANPRVFHERVALAVGLWAWERRPHGRR